MKYRILIVEDDEALKESISDMLEIKGYDVSTAQNGLLGINAVKEKKPDLIISDVMMPEMDGFEMLKEIKMNPDMDLIPIIMLTAKVELESKLKGLELGADDYLTKPFEFRELNLKIHNLLQSREKLVRKIVTTPQKFVVASQDDIFLNKLNLLLNEQLNNPKLLTESIASQLNMSLSTFNRRLQKITGKSPNQYLKEFRLNRAKEMIQLNYGNISEIANKTGYSSIAYFSSSYKDFFGNNPTEDSTNS